MPTIVIVLWGLFGVCGVHAWYRWDYIPPKIVRNGKETMQVYTVYDQNGRQKEASFTIIDSTKTFQK